MEKLGLFLKEYQRLGLLDFSRILWLGITEYIRTRGKLETTPESAQRVFVALEKITKRRLRS